MKKTLPRLSFVLGGARSGKSRFAESLVAESGLQGLYVATAATGDREMSERIAVHRARRGVGWRTLESPRDLPGALAQAISGDAVLIDCATLWLSNLMLAGAAPEPETDALLAALDACKAPVVVVSNEVGAGIVPDNALARRFRDAQGRLNQRLAAAADLAVLVAAGLPLVLKGRLP